VPQGERWTQCIANRVFKSKLIQLVIHRLTSKACMARLKEGQSMILDYQGAPVRHFRDGTTLTLSGMASLGEADVKFTRYTAMFDR
jgi:hypothetical protein